jgi:GNAT superfamily N-acetyltransferase
VLGIRRARAEDALEVAQVHVRAWQQAYAGLIDAGYLAALRPEGRAAGYWFGEQEPGGPEAIVAVEAGAIRGFATFGPCRDEDNPAAGEIFALYVDPVHWRGGVGRRLLGEARRRLRERGHDEAVLWVLVGNEAGERFYEADGWARDGGERTERPYGVIARVRRFRRALS